VAILPMWSGSLWRRRVCLVYSIADDSRTNERWIDLLYGVRRVRKTAGRELGARRERWWVGRDCVEAMRLSTRVYLALLRGAVAYPQESVRAWARCWSFPLMAHGLAEPGGRAAGVRAAVVTLG